MMTPDKAAREAADLATENLFKNYNPKRSDIIEAKKYYGDGFLSGVSYAEEKAANSASNPCKKCGEYEESEKRAVEFIRIHKFIRIHNMSVRYEEWKETK